MFVVFLAAGACWLWVPPPYHWVAPVVAVVYLVKNIRDSLTTRCPRCNASLGRLTVEVSAARNAKDAETHRRKAEELGGCPNCGLRLDEDIGSKA